MQKPLALMMLLGVPLGAQNILRVGAGGFAEIRDAITAAAPNDIVEVAPGNYQAFVLDKPLVITALPAPAGQIVQVLGTGMMTTSVTELRPPDGTRAFVTNIHFRNPWFYWKHAVRVTRGTVCFEECTLEAAHDSPEPGLRVLNAKAHLRHCLVQGPRSLTGTPPTIHADNSALFLVDCFVRGGDLAHKASSHGGNGIHVTDSSLHLVRTDVIAGSSNGIACISNWQGGHGVLLQGTSPAWLADCTVRGGDGSCRAGGDALRNLGTVPSQLARTTLTAGTGTPPGASSSGPTLAAPLLGLTGGTVGLVRGQPWTVNYRTEPSWPIAILLGDDVFAQTSPLVAEHLLLPLPRATLFAMLVADGNGAAQLQVAVPSLAVLQHQRVFAQAFSGPSLPARTQPALGGVIR
ncbi:MAG: hypothetical protein IPK26_03705 [Planctomycetes bacterium]|nr:hypothetical protein [Planctomycetota bacterium]